MGKVIVLLLFLIYIHFTIGQDDLENKIYTNYEGNPCVLLLNRDGQYGCRTSRSGVVGTLSLINDEAEFNSFVTTPPSDPKILVIPSNLLSIVDIISSLQKTGKVLGVILLDSPSPSNSFSPDIQNKDTNGFAWNPYGNSMFFRTMPFPLWLLGKEDSKQILNKALENRERDQQYPLNSAEITAFMHPEQRDNSYICLRRNRCKPLGGHSTWTSILPIDPTKEIILTMSSIDSRSLFQLRTIGADSSVSGTVALMTALDALVTNPKINITNWKKQPLFAFFDGESFGNIGSKKFLFDINNYWQCISQGGSSSSCGGANPYTNISLDKIASIVELHQVGAVTGSGFYVHTNDHNVDRVTAKTVIEAGMTFGVNVSRAATGTPGIPPSSLTAFLTVKPDYDQVGVVITDHAGSYENRYYESIFDGPENVNDERVCQAATLLARTLFALGNGISPNDGGEDFESIKANCSLSYSLLDCLTQNTSCSEMKALLPGLEGYAPEYPNHYVGVYQPNAWTIHQKFVHDWVSERASYVYNSHNCTSNQDCGTDTCFKGWCRKFNTYSHDAISTNVQFISGDFFSYWQVINQNDPDPVWAEADWTPIGLRIFQVSDSAIDYVFVSVAIIEFIITLGVIMVFKKKFDLWFRISRN